MSASELKVLSLEEIEATLEFLNGNGPQTMKVNVDALARTAREYHRLREAAKAFQELNMCYRIQKAPSMKLLDRCEKAREALKEGAECICGEINSKNCPVHQ